MESWKQIPIAENYEVSDFGRVRRLTAASRTNVGRLRKTYLNRKGYSYVSLRVSGKPRGFQVHRLVMLAFVGPSDGQVNHINGVKHDNRLDNLEYVSPHANYMHALDQIDTAPHGQRHGNAKLKDADIPVIFAMHESGGTAEEIARNYGVTATNIAYILNGKAWKRVSAR